VENKKNRGRDFSRPLVSRLLNVALFEQDHIPVDVLLSEQGCHSVSHGVVFAQGFFVTPQFATVRKRHDTARMSVDGIVPIPPSCANFSLHKSSFSFDDKSVHIEYLSVLLDIVSIASWLEKARKKIKKYFA